MSSRLDELVARLGAAPTDRSLDDLETQVMHGARRSLARTQAAATLAPVRVASVGLALALGIAAGGATALSASAAPTDSSLTEGLHLAPSSLLEDGR